MNIPRLNVSEGWKKGWPRWPLLTRDNSRESWMWDGCSLLIISVVEVIKHFKVQDAPSKESWPYAYLKMEIPPSVQGPCRQNFPNTFQPSKNLPIERTKFSNLPIIFQNPSNHEQNCNGIRGRLQIAANARAAGCSVGCGRTWGRLWPVAVGWTKGR